MDEINGWIALYKDIASLGFPVAMFLMLVGSFFDLWLWTKKHREAQATLAAAYEIRLQEWQTRCEAVESERNEWKQLTIARLSSLEERAREIGRDSRQTPRKD
jgi:hypothetical protein